MDATGESVIVVYGVLGGVVGGLVGYGAGGKSLEIGFLIKVLVNNINGK